MEQEAHPYMISDDADFTRPLATMLPGKAIRLVLNWIAINARNEHEIELRMPVLEEQPMVYVASIRMKERTIHVRYVRAAPELIGNISQQWGAYVTYRTRTLKERKKSVINAGGINFFLESIDMQNNDITFMAEQPATFQKKQKAMPSMKDSGQARSS